MVAARKREGWDEAVAWRLAQGELDEAGWRAFAEWLEVPAHAAAWAEVCAIDDATASVPVAATPAPLRNRGWRPQWWAGGAVAAAVAVAVMLPQQPTAPLTVIATGAGETRAVTLPDGSKAVLNGGTKLQFAQTNSRELELVNGEAMFEVKHDDARPFRVRSGATVVQDVGTRFNMVAERQVVTVGVAEGIVLVQPDAERVTLTAGREATVDAARRSLTVRTIAADAVGSWQWGELRFASAPFRDVAAALARRTGEPVGVASALQLQPFTGTVRVTGKAAVDVPHVAALIGGRARHDAGGWTVAGGPTPKP